VVFVKVHAPFPRLAVQLRVLILAALGAGLFALGGRAVRAHPQVVAQSLDTPGDLLAGCAAGDTERAG
jgi:hypothetical protein